MYGRWDLSDAGDVDGQLDLREHVDLDGADNVVGAGRLNAGQLLGLRDGVFTFDPLPAGQLVVDGAGVGFRVAVLTAVDVPAPAPEPQKAHLLPAHLAPLRVPSPRFHGRRRGFRKIINDRRRGGGGGAGGQAGVFRLEAAAIALEAEAFCGRTAMQAAVSAHPKP